MRFLIFAATLFFALPAEATSFTFTGVLADGGNITGTWEDDLSYSAFTLNPLVGDVPVQDAIVTSFCPDHCPFFGGSTSILFAGTDRAKLRLVFDADQLTFRTNASWLETYDVDGTWTYLIMVTGGSLATNSPQNSVGEPSPFLLLGLAMGLGFALKMQVKSI